MSTCPRCKSEQPNNAQFCSQCAEPLTQHGKKLTNSNSPWSVLLVLCVLGFAGYLLLRVVNIMEKGTARTNPPPTVSVSQIQPAPPQPHFVKLTNGAAAVNAASYLWYTFTVPPNANTVTVTGHFTATGGSGNDIECFILDEDGFVNFKNNHAANTYYNSGKVTTATIGATLPSIPGTYYLVFNNNFSLITPKAVQVDATLGYVQ